ncbi:Gamma-D-glutamyl-L-lysine endopeptidase,NlpC/P60 family [Chlamydia serpentis]|uniref:Gamma-D-glutamyl-L-lysine endopeptidase,NlpC/P60 family n=1 Tax=Chlamydia serpentis TaxID=1967782 RepID=A0A2R8FAR7_9CHLA|nr:NlpC/P60 family protein [Chlamydia serpentis]SPN73396.1 Gamma-D-glutamyl-L-lysine endopeptidase,NlpC/P60 family [Chlamydia serpentis]
MKHYLSFSPSADFFSEKGSIETQVLFGERILFQGNKCYAYSQLFQDQSSWKPYPGYGFCSTLVPYNPELYITPNVAITSLNAFLDPWNIPLPFGTLLCINSRNTVSFPNHILSYLNSIWGPGIPKCDPQHFRYLKSWSSELALQDAKLFLDLPYLWGGRSVHKSLKNSGLDCSGFMNLLYQAQGYNIPRNSMDQYADCNFITKFENLPPGGLVFLCRQGESRISHVMLKKDSLTLIHASGYSGKIEYFVLERDGRFIDSKFYIFFKKNQRGRAFFGVPKKRKAFL